MCFIGLLSVYSLFLVEVCDCWSCGSCTYY